MFKSVNLEISLKPFKQTDAAYISSVCKKVFTATSLFSIAFVIIFYVFSDKISLMIFKNLECAKYIKILSLVTWS